MNYRKIICSLLAVIFFLIPVQCFAANSVDVNRNSTITVYFRDEKTPIVGAKFNLYLVAECDKNGRLTVTQDFKNYRVDFDIDDKEALQTLAQTLEGYALRDDIAPLDSGTTDANGILVFPTSGKELKPGLYLVTGERHTQNDKIYDATPFIVSIPSEDSETGKLNYDVTVVPKYIFKLTPSVPDKEIYKVIKLWDDDGCESDRPEQITVELLRDGELYETIVLNEANRWTYRWESLEGGYDWSVAEDTPEGYVVSITQEGTTFIVTNKHRDSETPSEPSTPVTTTKPSDSETTTGQSTPPTEERVPQTGQLWWPVPMLVSLGVLLIVVGLIRRKNGE